MTENDLDQNDGFGDAERLLLHQLKILEWQADKEASKPADGASAADATPADIPVPDRWELMRGIDLYDWQRDCIDRWFNEGHRGTIKVVTGGGKTMLALAAAQRLRRSLPIKPCWSKQPGEIK